MISIIVPIYNVEKFLPQCLDSLISQTYRDIEIILVDDGSPDRCPEICDHYAKNDKRIVVIHQKNAGESAARNAGVLISKGEYIGFVDPDDWVSNDMYKNMLDAMIINETDMVICGYHYCFEDGSIDIQRGYKRREPEILCQKELMKRCTDIPPTIRHVVWNKLFHKRLFEGLFFQESLRASMDVILLTEYLLRVNKAVFLHEPLYYNRVRNGSATHGGLSIHSLADTYDAHRFMHDTIIKKYPELRKYSQAFLLDVYLLKFNEAKRKARECGNTSEFDIADLKQMRKSIHIEARQALFNSNIYWKTRLAYMIA